MVPSHSPGEHSLIVLEESFWSDLSCGSRMVIIPIFHIAGFVLLGMLIIFSHQVKNWTRGKPSPNYGWIKGRAAIVFGPILLFILALGAAMAPSVSRFSTDGSVLVESGCRTTTTYTKRIPLDLAKLTYKRSERRRGHDGHSLVVTGSGYTITLNLKRQKNYSVLARIAPGPMEQFARALREENRDIPPPLLSLLKQKNT